MSTGSGSQTVYMVEARISGKMPPCKQNGMILDREWRHVSFAEAPPSCGVPLRHYINPLARENGYLPYDAAMALAWGFLAGCEHFCVEVRLVEHEFKWSYSVERSVEGAAMSSVVGGLSHSLSNNPT